MSSLKARWVHDRRPSSGQSAVADDFGEEERGRIKTQPGNGNTVCRQEKFCERTSIPAVLKETVTCSVHQLCSCLHGPDGRWLSRTTGCGRSMRVKVFEKFFSECFVEGS